jgi:hypothetical protein
MVIAFAASSDCAGVVLPLHLVSFNRLSHQHFAQEGVLLAATLLEACWDNITQHESNSFDPFRPR